MATITASVGRGGVNRLSDVQIVQNLINQNIGRLTPLAPLAADGFAGVKTIVAIEEFQRRVMRIPMPDGRVDPAGRTLAALSGDGTTPRPTIPGDISHAPWIAVGQREIGIKESRGLGQNNPRILEYISTFPYLQSVWREDRQALMGGVDETPWCACFVNWCLIRAGKSAGPSARARDWLRYGTALLEPRPVPSPLCITLRERVRREPLVLGTTSRSISAGMVVTV